MFKKFHIWLDVPEDFHECLFALLLDFGLEVLVDGLERQHVSYVLRHDVLELLFGGRFLRLCHILYQLLYLNQQALQPDYLLVHFVHRLLLPAYVIFP